MQLPAPHGLPETSPGSQRSRPQADVNNGEDSRMAPAAVARFGGKHIPVAQVESRNLQPIDQSVRISPAGSVLPSIRLQCGFDVRDRFEARWVPSHHLFRFRVRHLKILTNEDRQESLNGMGLPWESSRSVEHSSVSRMPRRWRAPRSRPRQSQGSGFPAGPLPVPVERVVLRQDDAPPRRCILLRPIRRSEFSVYPLLPFSPAHNGRRGANYHSCC
jgi:hypothetical protein